MRGRRLHIRGLRSDGIGQSRGRVPVRAVRLTAIAVAVLLTAAIVAAATPASALVRPTSFAYVAPADNQVRIADAEGIDIRGLGVTGSSPKWSPDGAAIAYFSVETDSVAVPHIAIVDPVTDVKIDLAHPTYGDFSQSRFCWDLSSASILHFLKFTESPFVADQWLKVPAVEWGDLSPTRVFAHNPFVLEAWPMPDGMYAVIYQPYTLFGSPPGRMMGSMSVGIVDSAGHLWKTAPLPVEAINPSSVNVSPDGSKVVFSSMIGGASRASVFLWDVAANTVSVLYDRGDSYYNWAPRFTGDGASVLFTQADVGGSYHDLWTVNVSTQVASLLMADATQVAPKPAPLMPAATVSTPSGPSSVKHGRTFTVIGTVGPRHTTGTYVATLYCYRLESGDWVLHKMVKAKRYAYSSTKSKYSASLSLPSAGTWRIRAFHLDAGHRGSWSGYRNLTVK
jgi:hypothetical protein